LKDATEFFSSNSPNISAVIPAMDAIDEAFATGIIDQRELCAPLCYALSVGKKTLNKYYSLSDDSHIYRIAMVLHPSFKLSYFDDSIGMSSGSRMLFMLLEMHGLALNQRTTHLQLLLKLKKLVYVFFCSSITFIAHASYGDADFKSCQLLRFAHVRTNQYRLAE
ncbi:hypothetical protein BT96DRAFT_835879, partial [Gymnopus androsaceus JB14]